MKKLILVLIGVVLFAPIVFAADEMKKADLAGNWYPGSKEELTYLLYLRRDKKHYLYSDQRDFFQLQS